MTAKRRGPISRLLHRHSDLREENLRLREKLEHARGTLTKHLQEIADLQHMLLPQDDTGVAGIEMAASYKPVTGAGGDYYDIVPLTLQSASSDPTQPPWGAMIADASGHGPAAALEIAMLDAILRTYPGVGEGPAAVLNYVNRHFFSRQIRKNFITAFAVNYDPDCQTLHYSNAGHHPALLQRAHDSTLAVLDDGVGIPLGVDRAQCWKNVSVSMHPGDTLILYTDGVTEARSSNGERYGSERLKNDIGERQRTPQQLIDIVTDSLKHFRDGTPVQDDQTIVAIRIS